MVANSSYHSTWGEEIQKDQQFKVTLNQPLGQFETLSQEKQMQMELAVFRAVRLGCQVA